MYAEDKRPIHIKMCAIKGKRIFFAKSTSGQTNLYIWRDQQQQPRKKTKKNVYSSEIRRLLKMEYFEHLVDFLMNLKASGHFWCTEYFNMNLITIWLGNIIIANDTNLDWNFYFYFTTNITPCRLRHSTAAMVIGTSGFVLFHQNW